MSPEPEPVVDAAAAQARLLARIDQLEQEIAELKATTAATVASAQETLYWFERWGIDFNALFSRPQAEQARAVVRALRSVYRTVLRTKRRVLG